MINCCQIKNTNKKCVRDDGKVFSFPRRFSKKKCLSQPVRGYSMKSSCAPFVNCKKIKQKKENKKHKLKKKKSQKRKQKAGGKKNMLGSSLQICSLNPVTGYYRDGYCHSQIDDSGKHLVCATMTPKFLKYTKSQGNDLSRVVKKGDNWCLCESRWLEAYGAEKAPPVVMKATSELTDSKIQKKIRLGKLKRKSKKKNEI